MDKIKISKIEIEVGKNKFELSLAEAQELKKILNDTFPVKEVVSAPGAPIYIESHPQPYWRLYDFWCGSYAPNNETLCLSNSSNT